MNFSEFTAKSFPEKSVFDRKQFDFTTNLVKFFAIRFAYFLYKLGVTANLLNVITLVLSYFAIWSLYRAAFGEFIYFFVGVCLLYFQIFVDFVDGAIAKAQDKTGTIGHAFDNLGCDLARVGLFVLLGMFIHEMALVLANVFSGIVLFVFLPQTIKAFPQQGLRAKALKFFVHKFSLIGVRFTMVLIPALLGLVLYFGFSLDLFSCFFSYLYLVMASVWLFLCIPVDDVG